MSGGGAVASVHVEGLSIGSYRGLGDMNLENLSDVNILTGDNTSGKTSVLELMSTLEGPGTLSAWRPCARSSTRSAFRRTFFEEPYCLFPIDGDEKRVVFDVTLGDGGVRHISLVADLYETLLSEKEMGSISGLRVSGGEGQNQDQAAECMKLRAYRQRAWSLRQLSQRHPGRPVSQANARCPECELADGNAFSAIGFASESSIGGSMHHTLNE